MEFNLVLTKEITPEADDNKKAEAPVRFTIRALSNEERNACMSMLLEGGEMKVQPDLRKFFLKGVTAVHDCKFNGKKVETAEEFLAIPAGFNMFIETASEVVTFAGLRDEADLKN